MPAENLPEKLYKRHETTLALENPLVIDGEQALFAHVGTHGAQSALVYLPKSKSLINMTLAFVSGIVEEGGVVVLVGGNDAGIRSANEIYEKNIGPIEQKIVGNHSAMYVGKNQALGATKKLDDFLSYSPLKHGEIALEVAHLPGVFSAGALDAGTKLLLDTVPYEKKSVLDIGCGAGVIGAIYKKKAPESAISMCDVNPFAVEATKKTLEKNNIEAQAFVSDVFSNVKDKYGLILCNPPFHKGVSTDYSFIETFARDAKRHLNTGGTLYIVCNSFLSYERKLEAAGLVVSTAVDNGSFKVISAR